MLNPTSSTMLPEPNIPENPHHFYRRLQEASHLLQVGKQGFGEILTDLFLDSESEISVPSMIMLSTSDLESREVALRVTKDRVITTMAKWLGPPDANARALQIFLISTGFIFYTRNFPLVSGIKGVEAKLAKWFAQSIRDIVDIA